MIENKSDNVQQQKIVGEVNKCLAEIALWLPKDDYIQIFQSIKNADHFEELYPEIINKLRDDFKLDSIPEDYLQLIYLGKP